MSLFHELQRRNVFRVAIAYVVAAWVILQASSLLLEIFDAPASIMRVIVGLLAIGFLFSISFAWAFEVTPDGIRRESGIEHTQPAAHQAAKRLDMLTIGLVIVAIGLIAVDRFVGTEPETRSVEAAAVKEPDGDAARLTQQLLELDRLRENGKFGAAFALASEIEPFVQDQADRGALWDRIAWQTDIETVPPGATVYRQTMDAAADEWENLGVTPLAQVKFALDEGYRLRFELDGYRPVEVLHSAVRTFRWGAHGIESGPVKLDSPDVLPEEMVRIAGFTIDLVDYSDFFMDRYEVTNREFAQFVAAGGYDSPEYWKHPFVKDGRELSREEAMSEFVDRTGRPGPASWTGGAYPDGQGDFPVNGVSWYEAAAYAVFAAKQLPTIAHFEAARKYYIVDAGQVVPRSNLGGVGPRSVGQNQAMNTFGVYDLDGNVREWCWNEAREGTRSTIGAAWTDAPFYAGNPLPKPVWDRDPTNGIRLIRTFDAPEKLARLREPAIPPQVRDLLNERLPTEEEFNIYRRIFAYDPLPLNAETVAVDTFEHWDRVHVEFDLPYGERGGVYLYVPTQVKPPYEAVIYWGGSNVMRLRSVDREFVEGFNFIVRSGRVVAQPVLKGIFDRNDDAFNAAMREIESAADYVSGTLYRDYAIKWVQDVSRTVDYLDSRDDIRSDAYGFYGLSWGAGMAPIVLALDDRFGPAVLNVGGLAEVWRDLPEVDMLTYVKFVKNPVLMLNGRYDIVRPLETSQNPMFELLGTDPAHKKRFLAESSHVVPREDTVRETLDWYDRYLSGD